MPRSRRRRRAGGGEGWKIGLGILAGLVALGVLGGVGWLSATVERPPQLDAETLCPVDGPRSVTVVLLDASDALPDVAQRQVATALTDIAETLPSHGLLEVRLLDPANPSGRRLFARCNPGNGEGLSEWTANPAAARRRWLEDFREPVGEMLSAGLPTLAADTSPIMAAIQRVAVERFEGRAMAEVPKRLVIVSDMIENTPAYSQYGGDLGYARYRASPAAADLSTDLHGAEVTVYYVQRAGSGRVDSAAHIRFWSDWIAENQGSLVEAVKLQGAG